METIIKPSKNLLIGASGSVAFKRLPEIIGMFLEEYNIKLIVTNNSKNFLDYTISDYCSSNNVEILTDSSEWDQWHENKQVLHVEVYNN